MGGGGGACLSGAWCVLGRGREGGWDNGGTAVGMDLHTNHRPEVIRRALNHQNECQRCLSCYPLLHFRENHQSPPELLNHVIRSLHGVSMLKVHHENKPVQIRTVSEPFFIPSHPPPESHLCHWGVECYVLTLRFLLSTSPIPPRYRYRESRHPSAKTANSPASTSLLDTN